MYSREIDGEILTLASSGWTYRDTFVLFDFESESLWYHLEGETGLRCIDGKWKGRKLEEFTSTLARWNAWKHMNPDSKILDY